MLVNWSIHICFAEAADVHGVACLYILNICFDSARLFTSWPGAEGEPDGHKYRTGDNQRPESTQTEPHARAQEL